MQMVMVESDKLRKVANYVATCQALLKKHAATEGAIRLRAPKVVEAMVNSNLVSTHLKDAKVAEFVESPEAMCEAVEKMASLTGERKPTGKGVDAPMEKDADHAESANSQFERHFLGG